jgi:hypothetical protein
MITRSAPPHERLTQRTDMKVIVAAVLALCLATPAAADVIGIGYGTLSCGVWLEDSTNREARALYAQW